MIVNIEYEGIPLRVDGEHHKAEPDTNTKEWFEIFRIEVCGSTINIAKMVSDDQGEEIEKLILKEIND